MSDTQRLNWIIKRHANIESFGGKYLISIGTTVMTDWFATAREAIDAAMTAPTSVKWRTA
jgi:hypothetical protein